MSLNLIKEKNGITSTARLVMLTWGLGCWVAWAILSFVKGTLLAVPESVLVIILCTMGWKVVQTIFGENKVKE